VIQYQVLTTSGLSAAGPQSRSIFAVCFVAKKFSHVAMAKFKQLLTENLIRTTVGDRE
jgi:hypothetical protein